MYLFQLISLIRSLVIDYQIEVKKYCLYLRVDSVISSELFLPDHRPFLQATGEFYPTESTHAF